MRGLLGRFVPALPYTVGEIEAAGLPFDRDFMTRPFVNDALLDRLFGERAEWVRRTFLIHSHYDIWHFRPEFATQRAVDDFLRREYRGRPDEAQIRAMKLLGAKLVMPIHWGAYRLSRHGWDDPPERFVRVGEREGLKILTPRPGGSVSLNVPEKSEERWWRAFRTTTVASSPLP